MRYSGFRDRGIMAKLKLNHFAAKTVSLVKTARWETVLTEIFVAFFLGCFAYMGYVGQILILFFMCSIGFVLCLCAIGQTIFSLIKEARHKTES